MLCPRLTSAILVALAGAPAFAADKVTYDEHVRPIFAEHCLGCHNADKKKADLDLTSYSAMSQGSSGGKIFEPGDVDKSTVFGVVSHKEEPYMPPNKPRIPDAQLATLRKWIEGGGLENAGSTAAPTKPKKSLVMAAASASDSASGVMPGPLLMEPVLATPRPTTITALAHSPNAPLLAVGGVNQISLYNSQTLLLLGVLPFPQGSPTTLRFSRSGAALIAPGGVGAKSGFVVIYDVATGKVLDTVGQDYDTILSADLNNPQTMLATGGPDKLVKTYNLADGKLRYSIKKHTDWVMAVAFSPDGVLLASGDRNGGLYVWEAATGENLYELRGHTAAITSVAWRGDSNVLASSSEDGTVKLWDITNGNLAKSVSVHSGGTLDVSFSSDGRLVSAGRDKVARVLSGDGNVQTTCNAFGDVATRAAFSNDGKRVIAGDWVGSVAVFDVADGRRIGEVASNPAPIGRRLTDARTRLDASLAELNKLQAVAATQPTTQSATQPAPTTQASQPAATQPTMRMPADAELRAKLDAAAAAADAAREEVRRWQEADLFKQLLAARAAQDVKRREQTDAAARVQAAKDRIAAAWKGLDAAHRAAVDLPEKIRKAKEELVSAQAALPAVQRDAASVHQRAQAASNTVDEINRMYEKSRK